MALSEFAYRSNHDRHCERSEAIEWKGALDSWIAASLRSSR